MTKMMVKTTIMGLLAALLCSIPGCGGNSAALTPIGTVANLKVFDSTFTGKPNNVPLNFPSLTGTDPQGNPLDGS